MGHLFVILDKVVRPRICKLHGACIVLVTLDPVRELQGVGARWVYKLLRLPHHNATCCLLLLLQLLGVQFTGVRVLFQTLLSNSVIDWTGVLRLQVMLEGTI